LDVYTSVYTSKIISPPIYSTLGANHSTGYWHIRANDSITESGLRFYFSGSLGNFMGARQIISWCRAICDFWSFP